MPKTFDQFKEQINEALETYPGYPTNQDVDQRSLDYGDLHELGNPDALDRLCSYVASFSKKTYCGLRAYTNKIETAMRKIGYTFAEEGWNLADIKGEKGSIEIPVDFAGGVVNVDTMEREDTVSRILGKGMNLSFSWKRDQEGQYTMITKLKFVAPRKVFKTRSEETMDATGKIEKRPVPEKVVGESVDREDSSAALSFIKGKDAEGLAGWIKTVAKRENLTPLRVANKIIILIDKEYSTKYLNNTKLFDPKVTGEWIAKAEAILNDAVEIANDKGE